MIRLHFFGCSPYLFSFLSCHNFWISILSQTFPLRVIEQARKKQARKEEIFRRRFQITSPPLPSPLLPALLSPPQFPFPVHTTRTLPHWPPLSSQSQAPNV